MNRHNLLARIFRRPLVLAALAVALLSSAAQAASVNIEVKVAGYSLAGWIEVRPGSGTGGRVQYDSAHHVYYTDRVQRGETMRLNFTPTCPGEYVYWGDISPGPNPNVYTGLFGGVCLPFSEVLTCPTNPNWDNVYVEISTTCCSYQKLLRIPIGSR